jgi:hypothetical protein
METAFSLWCTSLKLNPLRVVVIAVKALKPHLNIDSTLKLYQTILNYIVVRWHNANNEIGQRPRMAAPDPMGKLSLFKRCASTLSPRLLFDPMRYGNLFCSG